MHGISMVSAFASVLCASFARADLPAVATFPPMSQDEVDRFRDSLKNDVPLDLVPPISSQVVDNNISGIWAGTRTEVKSSVGEVILRFRPSMDELLSRSTTTEDQSKALLNHFDLRLSLVELKRELTFIHSNAENPKEAKGFVARVGGADGFTLSRLIQGQRESSLYVAIPPVKDLSEGWGIYVCPRLVQYKAVGRTGTRALSLEKSPYDLSEMNFPIEVAARTSFESSRDSVRALIQMQPSSEMPETDVPKDQMISTTADPRLTYRPQRPFDFYRVAPLLDVQQGVNVVVELQNKTGNLRRQNFSHVVSVHKSNEPSPVTLKTSSGRPAGDSGDCYIVKVQKYVWTQYEKTPVSF
jgi:hypothetical protein